MNHVVEGILAVYSPFYAPAAVNLYFLEDFQGLREALVKVRPTVFFSVPQFYEKMRDGLMANGLARKYLEKPSGIKRWAMAPPSLGGTQALLPTPRSLEAIGTRRALG
jgi:long-chain acyl-CoA synthetase